MKTNTSTRLKEIMKIKNLKQIDILEKCKNNPYGGKVSKSDLSQYVSGKVLPRQDKLSILSFALNVDEAWLMGYDVPMIRDTKKEGLDIEKENFISNILLVLKTLTIEQLSFFNGIIQNMNGLNKNDIMLIENYISFIKSKNN